LSEKSTHVDIAKFKFVRAPFENRLAHIMQNEWQNVFETNCIGLWNFVITITSLWRHSDVWQTFNFKSSFCLFIRKLTESASYDRFVDSLIDRRDMGRNCLKTQNVWAFAALLTLSISANRLYTLVKSLTIADERLCVFLKLMVHT